MPIGRGTPKTRREADYLYKRFVAVYRPDYSEVAVFARLVLAILDMSENITPVAAVAEAAQYLSAKNERILK